MTGPSLDLDALRKKAERGYLTVKPDVILAVLALVEKQQAMINTLEDERSRHIDALIHISVKKPDWNVASLIAERALAGSPAENKQQ